MEAEQKGGPSLHPGRNKDRPWGVALVARPGDPAPEHPGARFSFEQLEAGSTPPGRGLPPAPLPAREHDPRVRRWPGFLLPQAAGGSRRAAPVPAR
ncbi:Hypothetical protein AA314_01136 [Archangium gephyra]|uniref:Uncharacterized protein n=1 Tax=Archangium gephyra TaxID=48 RepID=A0AAC8Q1X4_9BACT|nr:Hypothetical protein AA314_01136 [Archangium gephyra]